MRNDENGKRIGREIEDKRKRLAGKHTGRLGVRQRVVDRDRQADAN